MRKPVRLVVAAIVAVAIILLLQVLPLDSIKDTVREWLTPLQASPHLVAARTGEVMDNTLGGARLAATRIEMEKQLAALRLELADLSRLERENERLRNDLGFMRRQRLKVLASNVIGRDDVSGWWKMVKIDRGSRDGLVPDMAVIVPEGLVGRTQRVDPDSCDVLLLTDTTVRVGGRLARSGANGVVRGMGSEARGNQMAILCAPRPFRLDYVTVEAEIQKGDQILTSGLGGVFPADLMVGTVMDVTLDSSGLCRSATVAPAVDFDSLQYVFVVVH